MVACVSHPHRPLADPELESVDMTTYESLIGFDQRQVELHQSLIDINSKFIAGPRSGVDYPALAAKMPQIRAELEQTQKAVFEQLR